jgi:hypothetical protein
VAANTGGDEGFSLWGDDGFTFGDLVDVVNPLHHLPGVSTLYHYFTDDDIGIAPKLAGGMLFGGVAGLASSAVNQVLKEATGHTLGGHAITLFLGPKNGTGEKLIQVAKFFEPGPAQPAQPAQASLIPRAPTHVAVLRSYRPGASVNSGSPTGTATTISAAGNTAEKTPSGMAAGKDEVVNDWRSYAMRGPVAVLRRSPPATAPGSRKIAAQESAPPPNPLRPLGSPGRAVFQPASFDPPAPPTSLKLDGPEDSGKSGPWIAQEMMHNLDLYRRSSQPPALRRPTLDLRE